MNVETRVITLVDVMNRLERETESEHTTRLNRTCFYLAHGIPLKTTIKPCHCGGTMVWSRENKGRCAVCTFCYKRELYVDTKEI